MSCWHGLSLGSVVTLPSNGPVLEFWKVLVLELKAEAINRPVGLAFRKFRVLCCDFADVSCWYELSLGSVVTLPSNGPILELWQVGVFESKAAVSNRPVSLAFSKVGVWCCDDAADTGCNEVSFDG